MSVPEHSITGSTADEIAGTIEQVVARGQLASDERLPAVRTLARQLQVSPATVNSAYQQLRRRGVVVAHARQGVRVAAERTITFRPDVAVPEGVVDLANGNPDPALLPPLPALPVTAPRLYGEEAVLTETARVGRELYAADGLDADHVTLASGAMDAVERVLGAWLRPGDRIALEDPGYAAAFDLARALGLEPVPVPVDDRGPLAGGVASALAAGARALLVTPRAHVPTGAALDDERARELRIVLDGHEEVGVLEDDHAALIAGVGYTGLVGGRNRWAVVRSVSKGLGPDLRLAFVATDETTARRVAVRQRLGVGWVSTLLQRLATRQLRDPQVHRLLQRAAATYASRRAALVGALAARGHAATGRSGVNVWMPVTEEAPLVAGMRERGWAVRAGEAYRLASPPAVRITVAALPEDQADEVAAELTDLLAPSGRTLRA